MVVLLLFMLMLAQVAAAQAPNITRGQEVRVFTDSTKAPLVGRVAFTSNAAIGIERSPGLPPTRLAWGDIQKLEVRIAGEWERVGVHAIPNDTSYAAGALAGAAAARKVPQNYFVQSFLLALPVGMFGWCVFSDCGVPYKVLPVAGAASILLTWQSAQKQLREATAELERYDFADRSAVYTTAYREAYAQTLRSRYRKQVVGGAALGVVGGFAGLIALFASAYD